LRRFLEYTVEQTLSGNGKFLKEYTLAIEVFGKSADFDPRHFSLVRSQARLLRARLAAYYSSNPSAIQIVYLPGTYEPMFNFATIASPRDTTSLSQEPDDDTRVPCYSDIRALLDDGSVVSVAIARHLMMDHPGAAQIEALLALCDAVGLAQASPRTDATRSRARGAALTSTVSAPNSSITWTAMGLVHVCNDWDAGLAQLAFDRACSLAPHDPLPYVLKAAFCCLGPPHIREADLLARKAVALNSGSALIRYFAAWTYFCAGNLEQCRAHLDHAQRINPLHCESTILRPALELLSGRTDAALDATQYMPFGRERATEWICARSLREFTDLSDRAEAFSWVDHLYSVATLAAKGHYSHASSSLHAAASRQQIFAYFSAHDPRFSSLFSRAVAHA